MSTDSRREFLQQLAAVGGIPELPQNADRLVSGRSLEAQASRTERPGQKVLALGVDYADQIYHGYSEGYLYGEEKIRELVQTLKNAGIDEVYWRVSAGGKVTCPSKVMTVMDGSGLTNPGFSPSGVILKQC